MMMEGKTQKGMQVKQTEDRWRNRKKTVETEKEV